MSHAVVCYLWGIFVGVLYGVLGYRDYLRWRECRWQRKTQGKRRS